jgi:hypothetical protein
VEKEKVSKCAKKSRAMQRRKMHELSNSLELDEFANMCGMSEYDAFWVFMKIPVFLIKMFYFYFFNYLNGKD